MTSVTTSTTNPLSSSSGVATASPAKRGEYAGPYRLLETLGKGGLATVKIGVDFNSGKKVAVKIIDKEKLQNPREQVSMMREITIMKLLKHPNILKLYDVYDTPDKMYLILDLYAGGDLYTHLTTNGAMRPSEALVLFKQIIEGIEFCHKNLIVHRDLKPENLLLSEDKKKLVISDFGLSTGMGGSRNLLKTRCGTVHYISPEVAKGDPYVGMASDVWSCGVILYAMITASLPFDSPTAVGVLRKIVKGEFNMPPYLPKDLQDLIYKMMTLDPKQRITIPEIRKHPWWNSFTPFNKKSVPEITETPEEEASETVLVLTLEDLSKNPEIIENLTLLGWEDGELRNCLLAPENNIEKSFYKLLLEHKTRGLPKPEEKKAEKKPEPSTPPKLTSSATSNTTTTSTSSSTANSLAASDDSSSRTKMKHRSMSTENRADGKVRQIKRRQSDKRSSEKRPIKRKEDPVGDVARPPTIGEAEETISSSPVKVALAPPTVVRQRASTIGDGPRPMATQKKPSIVWAVSPTETPGSKVYKIEAERSIDQILKDLRKCFEQSDLEFTEQKKTKNGVKVRARRSGKKKGRSHVKIDILTTEDGKSVVSFKKGTGEKKEDFQEVVKKIEEHLVDSVDSPVKIIVTDGAPDEASEEDKN